MRLMIYSLDPVGDTGEDFPWNSSGFMSEFHGGDLNASLTPDKDGFFSGEDLTVD